MRLFIAIPLSTEMQKALVACMHDLKKQGVKLCSGGKPAYDPCFHRRI